MEQYNYTSYLWCFFIGILLLGRLGGGSSSTEESTEETEKDWDY